ncbi:hypothetical protein E5082_31555 [Streptomyces griseoluteus]|uniref:Pentapeptide repeat-containing protein n=1 Tax=Streptomyces griseoluteus TaxID=29306 RepID=A0A4Z1CX38_STRGP|nr:hypothetical protein [Streptomyces griseoluteus]TGN73548.1 hypothetical protein E5082_31555 [Streptomyces griseoluteus]
MAASTVVGPRKIVNADVDLSGFDLDGVEFRGCAIAQFEHPLGMVVRAGKLRRCKAVGCSVHGVRFEEILAENLTFSKLTEFAACAFRHVELKGRIGPFITTPAHYSLPADAAQAFRDSLVEYYRDVDWALDISAAEFSDASIYMVPGDLVKRDEDTQFLLRRSAFESFADPLPAVAEIYRGRFSLTPFDSYVAIAPVRSKNFKEIRDGLMELKRMGLAE